VDGECLDDGGGDAPLEGSTGEGDGPTAASDVIEASVTVEDAAASDGGGGSNRNFGIACRSSSLASFKAPSSSLFIAFVQASSP
jgi:hypothetical protein